MNIGRMYIPLEQHLSRGMNMTDINWLLDRCKEAIGATSDNQLAKRLGVGRSTVSNYRTARALPDAVVCAAIAGLSGEPLAKVLGIVGEARAISREEKAVWRKLAATAALVALAYYIAPIGAMEAPHGAWAFLAAVPVEWLPAVGIMRNLVRFIHRVFGLQRGNGSSALLA